MKLLRVITWFSLPWAFRPGSVDVSPCVSLQVFLAVYFGPLLTTRNYKESHFHLNVQGNVFRKKLKAFQMYGIH